MTTQVPQTMAVEEAAAAAGVAPVKERKRANPITVKDVAPKDFIDAYAKYLKRAGTMVPPAWAEYAKTGVAKETSPVEADWYYIRAASIARKIYLRQRTGIGALRRVYGCKKRNGAAPPHASLASGAVVRKILIQLETLKLVQKDFSGGRTITSTGRRELDRIAAEVNSKRPVLSLFSCCC